MKFGRRDDEEDLDRDNIDELNSTGWLKRATLAVVAIVIFAVAGAGWYAYDRGLVHVGEQPVPLIKAEAGDTKVRPEDPGGLQIPHQDKLVFERLAPDQAEPLVERLLPPPEIPIDRATVPEVPAAASVTPPPDRDLTQAPAPPTVDATTGQSSEAPQALASAETATDEPPQTPEQLLAEEPPAAPAEPVEQLAVREEATPAVQQPNTAQDEPTDEIAQVIENLSQELPQATPEPAPVQQATLQPEPKPTPEAPVSATASGWRIQVASLRDQSSAEGEWARLKERHADVLADLSLNLQRADLDSGTFYRIQAGPLPNRDMAQAACDRLKSRSQGCLIVGP